MIKKRENWANKLLEFFAEEARYLPRPFETPYGWMRRVYRIDHGQYYKTVYKLQRRGVVKISNRKEKKIISLTEKGRIESLLKKARMSRPSKWDGKWRLIIFDIPEQAREQRNKLRNLLKQNDYQKLQASVFISPHPLNREAIQYLNETNLRQFIRILRVDKLDFGRDLMTRYKLTYP